MRIPSGKTDQYIYFVAVDATDLKTRETGLSSFTVYRSRNGAAAAAFTTPTINETDSTNMPGVYELLLDEDTTIAAGSDSEEMVLHITQASMAPVTRTIELYRRDTTSGQTATVTSGGVTLADGVSHGGTLGSSTATLALSRASIVSQSSNTAALTVTGNGSGEGLDANGGATGAGATFTGGATSGHGAVYSAPTNGDGVQFTGGGGSRHGINATAGSSGSGINATGASSGSGIVGTGGATGTGIRGTGGGTSGAGLTIAAVNGNAATFLAGTTGDGINTTGAGTGSGIKATSGSGASGDGITALAASTNGNGIKSTGTGTGDGMELTAGASGVDLDADMTGNITGNLSGSVGSVTGAVGSVTGNVGGNVVGSVASVTAAVTVGTINANVVNASALAADAVTEIQAGLSTLTSANVSAAVWDAATASYGAAGSYGLLVETNLDAAVSSRLSTAGYTAPDNASISTILSDTNDIQTRLPAALVGGRIDASVGAMAANVLTAAATAADFTTEVQTGLATQASVDVIDANVDSILADTGTDGVVISAATQGAIADKLLGRSLATGADGGRTVQDALRANRNKQAISAGTLTVYQEDDATPAWTAAVVTTPGDPLSSMDPA